MPARTCHVHRRSINRDVHDGFAVQTCWWPALAEMLNPKSCHLALVASQSTKFSSTRLRIAPENLYGFSFAAWHISKMGWAIIAECPNARSKYQRKKSGNPRQFASFVAQSFNRVQARGSNGRYHPAEKSHHTKNDGGDDQRPQIDYQTNVASFRVLGDRAIHREPSHRE